MNEQTFWQKRTVLDYVILVTVVLWIGAAIWVFNAIDTQGSVPVYVYGFFGGGAGFIALLLIARMIQNRSKKK